MQSSHSNFHFLTLCHSLSAGFSSLSEADVWKAGQPFVTRSKVNWPVNVSKERLCSNLAIGTVSWLTWRSVINKLKLCGAENKGSIISVSSRDKDRWEQEQPGVAVGRGWVGHVGTGLGWVNRTAGWGDIPDQVQVLRFASFCGHVSP